MSRTVAVRYGLFGGEHIGKRLRRELRAAGYTPVQDTSTADIVIAHSAGCFWLPEPHAGQKYLLIGPPYWPGRRASSRFIGRARSNLRPGKNGYDPRAWVSRNVWGAYYALFDLPRNIRVLTHGTQFDLTKVVKGRRTVLVRNQRDGWLTPDLAHLQIYNPSLKIIEFPGDHGDIIHNPEPYVALLKTL